MEPRSKSKKRKVDFFNDLPDSIFHKILSLLDIKHVGRVSTLSRRCRKNCLSMPFLTIDLGKIPGPKKFYRFSSFLQRFMSLRNGIGIHSFEVEMHVYNLDDDFELHIGNWVLEASKLNVEKICLRLGNFKNFTLPSGVLNSACLRDLEVSLSPDAMLNLPTISFGGLENLRLRNVRVSNKFGELISSCKSLKMVYLHQVVAGIDGFNFSCQSLERLVLENISSPSAPDFFSIKISAGRLKNLRIAWVDTEPLHSLTLYAPKLEQFSWGGFVSHYSCEGNLESLWHSDISALFIPSENEDNEHMALGNGIIGKLLQSMYNVSSISIHDYSIKEISSRELLPEFCNLRSLTLTCLNLSLFGGYCKVQSIISLLNSMPHLNTMKIDGFGSYKDENICHNAEYWESQNLKFVHSLKEIKMEIEGEQNELELIKYLLKNAKALKKITIRCHSCKSGPSQSEISRKIEQFQLASSSIAIYYFHTDV